jgi:hypothetical protein
MTLSPEGIALITKAPSNFGDYYADRFERRGLDRRCPQPRGPFEVDALNESDRSLVVSTEKSLRILVVDAALALHQMHLVLLRSIPAIVETLASCAEMYLHEEHAYALVILVLEPQSRETAEAAQFVRHRWSGARILLLERESAEIDDWLYDERVDPHLHPAAVYEAAIRLMAEEKMLDSGMNIEKLLANWIPRHAHSKARNLHRR